jgi:hypothetical protein
VDAVVVTGNVGWRNADRPANGTQFEVYGPEGRWNPEPGGSSLIDALVDAGAGEGDRLIVIAVPRSEDADGIEASVREVLTGKRKPSGGSVTVHMSPPPPTVVYVPVPVDRMRA